jgi:AcrR family transcriptional regulator
VGERGDKRLRKGPSKGQRTQEQIVDRALHLAGREGLAAISIGRLAETLRMSKSGLFVHFGSKEKLEAAVVARAGDVFRRHVLDRAQEEEVREGIERVWALCNFWLEFVEKRILPGDYFFSGAFFLHAGQDGSMARQIREVAREWFKALRTAVNQARRREEIDSEVKAQWVAFELNGLLLGAQWSRLVDPLDYPNARSPILTKLKNLATKKIPEDAFESVTDWRHYLRTRPK